MAALLSAPLNQMRLVDGIKTRLNDMEILARGVYVWNGNLTPA